MSLAVQAATAAGVLAAAGAVVSLWRGAGHPRGPARRGYQMFAVAVVLWCAGMVLNQALVLPVGTEAIPLSFADLPALLALPVAVAGLARLVRAQAGGRARPLACGSWPGTFRVACLADGYVLASSLFLIGWALLFGSAFVRAAVDPATFAVELVHSLADMVVLGITLPLAGAAGRHGAVPYLALMAVTASDSLAVTARVTGAHPGVASLAAAIAGFCLLALAPRASGWPDRPWWQRMAAVRRAGSKAAAGTARTARGLPVGPAPVSAAADLPVGPAPVSAAADLPVGPAPVNVAADLPADGGDGAREAPHLRGHAGGGVPAAAAAAAAVAALVSVAAALDGGHMFRPVVLVVASTTVLTLALRVMIIVRQENSASQIWQDSGWQFRQLADRTSDVVLICDQSGVIRYASRAVAGYGYSPQALRGRLLTDLLHPEDRAGGTQAVRGADADETGQTVLYSCRVRSADGTWRHVESTVSRHRGLGEPDRLLITARDVSAQVALRRQVTHLTFHDGLTGLPNRAYVEQRARGVLSQSDPASGGQPAPARSPVAGVVFLDLDGFTAVNNAAGHSAGDLLLAQVAHRLRAVVPPQDTLARWGGDEFAVLIEGVVSTEEVVDVAERLSRAVSGSAFRVGDMEVSLTASVGVALSGDGPAGYVWRNADTAMSRAKEAGGGRVELFAGPGSGGFPPAGPRSSSAAKSGAAAARPHAAAG